ncbi:MAG: penicillin-binding protein 2 [Spirochaetes bacterium]|nr:penicillin-binding protein 2 [Spirochaetota bacterium]
MAKTIVSPRQFFFFRKRFVFLRYFVSALFIILFIQTSYLQIIEGDKYEKLALNNKEQYIPIPTHRGEIFDRSYDPSSEINAPLVTNEEKMGIYILPVHLTLKDIKKTLYHLSHIMEIDYNEKLGQFTNRANFYEPFLVKDDVPIRIIAQIGEKIQDLPGVYWEPIYYRKYPLGHFASHILGFVGKINKHELTDRSEDMEYHLNSMIGKIGIEKYYDRELRGEEGRLLRIVDALNRIKDTHVVKKPVPGYNLVLTLDKRIQDILEKVMTREKGAAIVIKPDTGEILGMVSKPDFDPNIFIKEPDVEKILKLTGDPDKPFLNRAIQAKYPPGSVFKIVTATAGLEEEAISRNDTFLCRGYFRFEHDDRVFHCTGIHGYMNILTGVEFSCNVFFFNVSYKLGSRKITKYAKWYGFGERTGIDLPGEQPGFLPTHKWKKKIFGENWYDGDTINYGIGQGFLLSTVLQVANMTCGIANDGLIYQPHILQSAYSAETGDLIFKKHKKLLHNIPIREEKLSILRNGLHLVCTYGTANVAGQFSKISMAGKTSTAQNTFGEPHAWFSCYAPYNRTDDRIVVCVFIENGGGGGEVAAPVAVAILNAIFKDADPVSEKKKIRATVEKERYKKFLRRMQDRGFLEDSIEKTDIQF